MSSCSFIHSKILNNEKWVLVVSDRVSFRIRQIAMMFVVRRVSALSIAVLYVFLVKVANWRLALKGIHSSSHRKTDEYANRISAIYNIDYIESLRGTTQVETELRLSLSAQVELIRTGKVSLDKFSQK